MGFAVVEAEVSETATASAAAAAAAGVGIVDQKVWKRVNRRMPELKAYQRQGWRKGWRRRGRRTELRTFLGGETLDFDFGIFLSGGFSKCYLPPISRWAPSPTLLIILAAVFILF